MRPLKSSVPMFQLPSIVTVLPVRKPLLAVAPESSMMQVSCASGKSVTTGVAVAEEDVDHTTPDQVELTPFTLRKYLVTPAPNVMLLLFRQLPKRVPVHGEAAEAPAATMSRKSTSDNAARVWTVKVRCVPMALLRSQSLRTAVFAAPTVNVPVTVWFPEQTIEPIPSVVLEVKVKVAKVFAPEIVTTARVRLVKLTVLYVRPPPAKEVVDVGQVIVDVPALKVMPVALAFQHVAAATVIDELPKDTERVRLPVLVKAEGANAKLAVANVPLVTTKPPELEKSLPKVHPPLALLKLGVMALRETLFVVTVLPVLVAKKFSAAPKTPLNATPVAAFSQLP